jgi:hypothetical protein
MARAAAAEAGIPGLWHRLRGDTREELRADAEELAYERDHPPDQATLDREAAENEARIAECKEQVAANKAEIAEIKARIDPDLDDLPEELLQAEGPLTLTGTDEDGNVWTGPVERIDLARGFADRRRIDAQIAKLDARADGYVARFEGIAYRYLRVDEFLYWTSRSLWTPARTSTADPPPMWRVNPSTSR